MTVDHETVTTDLGVQVKAVVTATGSMGFSGPVNLAVTAVDSTGAPIADWTPAVDNATITLTENGTGTANVTMTLPGDVAELMGNIKIAATSTAAEADAQVAVTANPVLDVVMVDNANGTCTYDGVANKTFNLKLGRSIWVVDGSTTGKGLITHVDSGISGFNHQSVNNPVAVGEAYKSTPTSTGTTDFYCHGANGTMQDGNTGNAPNLKVVN